MDPAAMTPYGLALLAYADGQTGAELTVRRDDGVVAAMPAGYYFRPETQLTAIETAALERCRGRVLDVGAGAGSHSLVLQSRGFAVAAIDVCREAVQVMRRRGVREAILADIMEYHGGAFDTLLLLGHGIGVVEDLQGLDAFLEHAGTLLRADGRILLDSLDVMRSPAPENVAYHQARRRAGRYAGEIRMQVEFEGVRGPLCGWLHVDPRTLAGRACAAGWACEVVIENEAGEYLAQLRRCGELS